MKTRAVWIKDQIVHLRMTRRERERCIEAALRAELRLSEWLRLLARDALRREGGG